MNEELTTLTVVQHNTLLESGYSVNLDGIRLLYLAMSKIDSKSPHTLTPYILTTEEYSSSFNIDRFHAATRLKKSAQKLLRTPITLYSVDQNGKLKGVEYPWFSKLEYFVDEQAYIEVVFSEYVRPYLYELKKDFTQLDFQQITLLDSEFSVRLFGLLSKVKKLHKNSSGEGKNVTYPISFLRERMGLENKYSDYRDFKKRVIDPAIKKINAVTTLSVSYNQIKSGRSVVALDFFFIDEVAKEKNQNLIRPRLPRRPRVVVGSHEEGIWARNCVEILAKHSEALFSQGLEPSLDDVRKTIKYYEILGDKFAAQDAKQYLLQRTSRKNKTSTAS